MANVNTRARVLVRDGFCCHYCGRRLLLAQAIKVLDWYVPALDLWDPHGKLEPLRSRWATVDHLIPEKEGGIDSLDNLVASCVLCNSQKGDREETLSSPRAKKPTWDGLSSIYLAIAPDYRDRLSNEDIKWQEALKREGVAPSTEKLSRAVEVLNTFQADPSADFDELLEN